MHRTERRREPYETDRKNFSPSLDRFGKKYAKALPDKNDAQHTPARRSTQLLRRSGPH